MTAAALDLDDPKYPASWEEDTFPTPGGTHAPDGSPLNKKGKGKGTTVSNGNIPKQAGKKVRHPNAVDTWE
jgi:hypothetical protein